MAAEKHLDCTGLACPQPVILTKDTLLEMKENILFVEVDNEAACANVTRFAESQGHEVAMVDEKDDFYILKIVKGEGGEITEEPAVECPVSSSGRIAVYVTSEFMGSGDDELGAILMGAYFETLNHFAKDISHILLVNSAVKLAIEGSPVLDHLRELEQMGIEVLACGTCLNFFKVQEKLGVGRVSNMFSILDAKTKAPKVLSP